MCAKIEWISDEAKAADTSKEDLEAMERELAEAAGSC